MILHLEHQLLYRCETVVKKTAYECGFCDIWCQVCACLNSSTMNAYIWVHIIISHIFCAASSCRRFWKNQLSVKVLIASCRWHYLFLLWLLANCKFVGIVTCNVMHFVTEECFSELENKARWNAHLINAYSSTLIYETVLKMRLQWFVRRTRKILVLKARAKDLKNGDSISSTRKAWEDGSKQFLG